MKKMFNKIFGPIIEFIKPVIELIDWSKMNKKEFIVNYLRFMLLFIVVEVLKSNSNYDVRLYGRILDSILCTIYMMPVLLLCFGTIIVVLNLLGNESRFLNIKKFEKCLDFLLRECYGFNVEMLRPLLSIFDDDDDNNDDGNE